MGADGEEYCYRQSPKHWHLMHLVSNFLADNCPLLTQSVSAPNSRSVFLVEKLRSK